MFKFQSFIYSITLFMLALNVHPTVAAKQSTPVHPQAILLPAALPFAYREEQFQATERAFEQRWNLFIKGKQFKNYVPKQTAANIAEEFKHLQTLRLQTYFTDPKAPHLISKTEYMIAQDLLEKGFFRAPNTVAFQYNRTDPTYNSSTIVLNGFRFLALEGPRTEHLRNFFTLLQNHQITQLVRLTAAKENGESKTYPYWQNNLKRDEKSGDMFLRIPQYNNNVPYKIRYYAMNNWQDQKGISAQALLNLILKVRKHYEPTTGLLATHCASGVGRTGTFLAGYVLLDEIDKQMARGVKPEHINLSIEKIVLQLSLQRPYMVTKGSQYESLYRLVDLYLSMQTAK